ncbi:PriCT-2 domain-containing protein [Mesorhizobium sp. M0184]|uniref:VapE domain-containing protein n=1 Tax=Mesorhizobium sp. M0184 TaxID=2956906 RepID=UPI00333DA7F1
MANAPTLGSVFDSVRPLIEAGASLHWLVPFEKRPIADEWSKAPLQTEASLRASYRENANIGIRLGEPSKTDGGYLHLIDLDIRKRELAAEAWARLLELWPAARSFPSGISGSGGESRHLYFLTDAPFPKKKLAKSIGFTMVFDKAKGRDVRKYDWEIDLYGTGAQAVLPPSIHPETRLPYRWERPLDLDMPFLMTIGAALIEQWGISASTAPQQDDEDDLFSIVRAAPMDLEEGKINEIMAGLPADWVDDRDQWLTVGAALHHQFEGANEGFERWNEWAKQSPKFDARDSARVWKSFKGSKNPVRMATLIQAVNAVKLANDLGLDDDFDLPAVIPAKADSDLSDLLGVDDPQPTPQAAATDVADPDWLHKLHRNEEGELKSTLPNVALIVDNDPRIRGTLAYNEFAQEVVLKAEPKRVKKKRDSAHEPVNLVGRLWEMKDTLNGDNWTDSHDAAVRSLIESKTQLKGYGIKVSDRDLRGGIDMSAQKRRFHPIKELLTSVKWDGKCRAETLFIDYLGCTDNDYNRQAALMMLVGAVARVMRPGHKFDFVPILEGVQGKGKSTFIEILALHWYNELTGDISDPKQMVELMQGSWILELGELSSMARAEVNDLKAFVSRKEDKVRLAWEKRAKDFPRQCIFIGSTNDREYLRDMTGGRRFWPIVCNLVGQIDNPRLRREVMQIWAEAVAIYHGMSAKHGSADLPLHLTDEAAATALVMQESRRVETSEEMLAGKIEAWLTQPIGTDERFDDLDADAPKAYRDETCVQQIWEEMLGRDGSVPHTEAMKIGKAMLIVGWPRTEGPVTSREINKKFGKCRVYQRPED